MAEEPSDEQKLAAVMYAMTLDERAEKRELWLNGGAFHRMHRRGPAALFNYWQARLAKDPAVKELLDKHWEQFVQHHADGIVNEDKSGTPLVARTSTPSAWEMAKSFAASMAKFAKNGFKITPDDILQVRIATCMACDKWNAKAFGNTGKCTLCGCSTHTKLRLATEKCPIDKWGPC